MCDESTENDILRSGAAINRRRFTQLGTVAGFVAMLPLSACASESVSEQEVSVTMSGGVSDCYFAAPSKGRHPAIIMWPDIKGLRPAFKAMGKRLAMSGYAVLVVNPFYGDAKAPVVGPDASFSDPETRSFLRGMASKLTQDASMADARDYMAFLDAQSSVDVNRRAGTAGYCMGGPLIIRTAGALPERIGAAASFHGGGMVRDTPDSPHLLIAQSKASALHAVAQNDDEKNPQMKIDLARAYEDAGLDAEIEVYEDTLHGWCPPDSGAYNEAQAERAWSRMLHLFETALA